MILALALIFGIPSLLCIFWGVVKESARRQRVKRAAEIRGALAAAEAVRIDALTIGACRRSRGAVVRRRGPDLPSTKRTVS